MYHGHGIGMGRVDMERGPPEFRRATGTRPGGTDGERASGVEDDGSFGSMITQKR